MRLMAFMLRCAQISSLILLLAPTGTTSNLKRDSIRTTVDDLMTRAVLHFKTNTLSSQDSALLLSDSAEALARKEFGLYDSSTATALALDAFGAIKQIDSQRADSLARESIRIWQTIRGKDCPQQAYPLRMLTTGLSDQGREVEAEKVQKRAIELLQAAPDYQGYSGVFRMPHFLALLINNQGNYYIGRDLAQAERLYKEAGDIWTKAYGADSPEAAVTSFNLARIALARRDFTTAESLARKALLVYAKTPVEKKIWPTDVAESYLLLSEICANMGRWNEADSLTNLAIAGYNETYGESTPGSLPGIQNAKYVATRQRNWAKAVKYAEEEIRVLEKYDIQSAAARSTVYLELARFYFSLDDRSKSLIAYDQSLALRQSFIRSAFAFASERNKMAYLRMYPLIYQSLLTLAVSDTGGRAIASAFDMVLSGKGAVLDALAQERQVALCSDRPELHRLVKQHAAVCDSIAGMAVRIQELGNPIQLEKSKRLYEIKDSLELSLSHQCAEFERKLRQDTISSVRVARTLPKGSVLWEFVRYWPYNLSHPDRALAPRYLAFALNTLGQVRVSDLGEAKTIDSLIDLVHQEVNEGVDVLLGADERALEQQLADVTKRLYQLVFAPLQPATAGCDHIFIAPDGQLSLLPFEMLVLPNGRYVVEDYQVTYLSSGRDLPRFESDSLSKGEGAIVISAPDYESAAGQPLALAVTSVDSAGRNLLRGPSDRTACLTIPFSPLPASAREGKAVADILAAKMGRAVSYLEGRNASEESLETMLQTPRILHIATHGYFCPRAQYSDLSSATESPLLYAGLALAGSNQMIRKPTDTTAATDDGILTALEASGLNLQGTDLVVLSACQTGMGTVQEGEGVYGLRRAFQLAGARAVVMSMFNVPDMTARDLMTRFYTDWLSGTTKSKALRNAMLAELRYRREQRGAAHPLFWGGFILAGDYK